ncbi:MAG: APC family permease, partial [Actinobacteria bacterium]|nr:APC family permease [Actinomycetota bacterium]
TTWTMGANRAAAQAASEGELPEVLGREHPVHKTPLAALLITGGVSTFVLIGSALFINTQDNLFFAIFAASSVIFLLPYLLMFPAVVVLRRKDPERERPFRIPGGTGVVVALATLTTIVVAAAAVLFVWPEVPQAPAEWSYTGPLLAIVVGALAVGELIVWRMSHPRAPVTGRPERLDAPEAQAGPPQSAAGGQGA